MNDPETAPHINLALDNINAQIDKITNNILKVGEK